MNQPAKKFVKSLTDAFASAYIEPGTKERYIASISRWHLAQDEWDRALEDILENWKSPKLPPVGEVIDYIKRQISLRRSSSDLNTGWIFYTLAGNSYAHRVVNQDGVWLNASMQYRDFHGQMNELGIRIGEPAALSTPDNAENIQVVPDHPPRLDPNELPTKEEREEYLNEIRRIVARQIIRMQRGRELELTA